MKKNASCRFLCIKFYNNCLLSVEFLLTMYNGSETVPVPAFLTKLWSLVDDEGTNELICWNANGRSFLVLDQSRFAKEILPAYFKHNNFASFVRQLNMYGFHKVGNMEQGSLKVEREEVEFAHMFFIRGHEDLLDNIKRKVSNARIEYPVANKDGLGAIISDVQTLDSNIRVVLGDVQVLQENQTTLTSQIENMSKENGVLWRQVTQLRQKQEKYERVVSKLIQLLASIVQPNKRKMSLMLQDNGSQPPTKMAKFSSRRHSLGEKAPTEEAAHRAVDAAENREDSDSDVRQNKFQIVTEDDCQSGHLSDDGYIFVGNDALPEQLLTEGTEEELIVGPILSLPEDESSFPMTSSLSSSSSNGSSQVITSTGCNDFVTDIDNILEVVDMPNELHLFNICHDSGVVSSSGATQGGMNPPTNVTEVEGGGTSSFLGTVARQELTARPLLFDRLDSMDIELETLRDALSSGQYSLDPTTLLDLMRFDDDRVLLHSFAPSLEGSILGNEVIQYNPQQEDLSSIFDFIEGVDDSKYEEQEFVGVETANVHRSIDNSWPDLPLEEVD